MKKTFLSIIAAMLVLILAGCAGMPDEKVPDLPALKVAIHEDTPLVDIVVMCWPHMRMWQKLTGMVPIACTNLDFEKRTCDIYLPSWAWEGARQHELAHCDGMDHDGLIQEAWQEYKDAGGE